MRITGRRPQRGGAAQVIYNARLANFYTDRKQEIDG